MSSGNQPSSYYYSYSCSSSSVTKNNNGEITSKQAISLDDNGHKDEYSKESIHRNGIEEIIQETGNKDLQNHRPRFDLEYPTTRLLSSRLYPTLEN